MLGLRPSLIALAIVLTGSGCTTAPDYIHPEIAAPSNFVSSAAINERYSGAEAVDLVNWWRMFDDPLLTSLIEWVIGQNLDLAQAEARVRQARAALRFAGADLGPSVQATSQAGANYQSLETPIGRFASSFPEYDRGTGVFEGGVGGSWELDVFDGKDAARDAARADWQASEAAAVAVRISVAAQTAETYIAIRELQQRLETLREQEAAQARLTELVELQFSRGVAAELQLRQAEGSLQQVRAQIPALRQELDTAMYALDILLGLHPGATTGELAKKAPVPSAPALTTAGGPAELLRRRPDIIAAERRLAAANSRIGVAIADYYPKFSLNGLLGAAATGPISLIGSDGVQASGVLGLRWRLFDFGRIDAQIDAARGAEAETLAAYRLTVLRASQDVETAFSLLLRQEDRANELARGEASLARARQSSELAYNAGFASLIEVLDADRRLLETRDALIQARAASSRGAVASFRALGGGWQGADLAEEAKGE